MHEGCVMLLLLLLDTKLLLRLLLGALTVNALLVHLDGLGDDALTLLCCALTGSGDVSESRHLQALSAAKRGGSLTHGVEAVTLRAVHGDGGLDRHEGE